MEPPEGGFFNFGRNQNMNIFVYSDESGVFDKIHNDYYIYGGLIFLDKETRDVASRKYIRAEQSIRSRYPDTYELKACKISNKDKSKLFRSLNQYIKFGVIIREKDVYPDIESVEIKYCNSEKTTLIRSADIVANRIFYEVTNGDVSNISEKICLKYLP